MSEFLNMINMNIINLIQRPEIINVIAPWQQEEWGYLNPENTLTDRIRDFETHLDSNLIPSTYVAVERGVIFGSASIVQCDMDTHKEFTPWLASVYVNSKYRNKGVGSLLVKEIVERASETPFEKLFLFTPSKEKFYKNLGWQTLSKEEYRGTFVDLMSIEIKRVKPPKR